MSRDVPTTTESCDGCGASDVLVFDFMGDYFCSECATEPCCDNENRSFAGGWPELWRSRPMKREKIIYDLIAEVARYLPGATFTAPGLTMRDGKTRIVIMNNENVQQFVIVHPFHQEEAATAKEIIEHFERDDL